MSKPRQIRDDSVVIRVEVAGMVFMAAVDRLELSQSQGTLHLYDFVKMRIKEACQEIESKPQYQEWLEHRHGEDHG